MLVAHQVFAYFRMISAVQITQFIDLIVPQKQLRLANPIPKILTAIDDMAMTEVNLACCRKLNTKMLAYFATLYIRSVHKIKSSEWSEGEWQMKMYFEWQPKARVKNQRSSPGRRQGLVGQRDQSKLTSAIRLLDLSAALDIVVCDILILYVEAHRVWSFPDKSMIDSEHT
jgi:hypothetical protein